MIFFLLYRVSFRLPLLYSRVDFNQSGVFYNYLWINYIDPGFSLLRCFSLSLSSRFNESNENIASAGIYLSLVSRSISLSLSLARFSHSLPLAFNYFMLGHIRIRKAVSPYFTLFHTSL